MIPATSQSTMCSMLDQDDHHTTGVRTDRSTPRRTLDRYAARTDDAEPQHALRRLCNCGCWLAERGWVIYLRMEEGAWSAYSDSTRHISMRSCASWLDSCSPAMAPRSCLVCWVARDHPAGAHRYFR